MDVHSRRTFLKCAAGAAAFAAMGGKGYAMNGKQPNIVVILADDLGYGDVGCYDPEHCRVPTPHIDQLASEGILFTDAHAGAALCTPSRYSLLTGRYSWRSSLEEHVVRPYGSPLIAEDRLTLPKMLKEHGYYTACIGKWHLGFNWPLRQEDGSVEYAPDDTFIQQRYGDLVFELPIKGGPTTRGFDEYFGVDLPNSPPYTFIENDRMTANPTDRKTINDRVHWGPEGPMEPGWRFDRVQPTLVDKAEDCIARCAEGDAPFFLYMPLTIPHEPIAPSEEFRGKSGISDVADLILETDAAVGRIMATLDAHGLTDNTLLIFTSDNGHCSYTGIMPFQEVGHRVGGPYRGYKCNISEGGHRIPLVARWPGVIAPGRKSDALVCLSDWMATCATALGATLPDDAAEDSLDLLPHLRGETDDVREDVVVQSYFADVLMIRRGPWKLSVCAGDGVDRPWCTEEGVPHDISDADALAEGRPPMQLYNVVEDPGETRNLIEAHPDIVEDLLARMQDYIDRGRSTPGPQRKNDQEIRLRIEG